MSTPYERAIEPLRAIATLLRQAGVAVEALEAQRAALAAQLGGGPVVVDPPIVVGPDPPIVDPPLPPIVVGPWTAPPRRGVPNFSEFSFEDRMPTWAPYEIPTEEDCDWIVDCHAMVAHNRHGLPDVVLDATGNGYCGPLFKRSMAAGHGPRITFGIIGDGKLAALGGMYPNSGGADSGDVCWRSPSGAEVPVDVQFVGLSADAEIQVAWGGQRGRTERLGVFDIGVTGFASNHALGQTKPCGTIIFDHFWVLPPRVWSGGWSSLFHVASYDWMVIRNMRRKGRSGAPPVKFREHPIYDKGSTVPGSAMWCLDNDLTGGNRCGIMRRPGRDDAYGGFPEAALVVADNWANDYGWEHPSPDGGAVFTLYAGGPLFLLRNEALRGRYKQLLVSGQPLYTGSAGGTAVVSFDRNWYDTRGFPVWGAYVAGNKLSNPGSQRHCVQFAHVDGAYVDDTNEIEGRIAIDPEISMKPPLEDRTSERVFFIGDPAKLPTGAHTKGVVDATNDEPMDAARFAAMHRATWAEALAE